MRTLTTLLALLLLAAVPVQAQKKAGGDVADNEAEAMLKSLRDRARIQYAKDGKAPKRLIGQVDGARASVDELEGEHYFIHDRVYVDGDSRAILIAETFEKDGQFRALQFTWAAGGNDVRRFDTFEEIEKAFEGYNWSDRPKRDTRAADQWDALYKVGATWVTKVDHGIAIYSRTEVKAVTKGVATLAVSTRFGDKGDYTEPVEITNKRPKRTPAEAAPPGAKLLARGEAKVGKWECDWVEYQIDGKTQRYYTHRTYGLLMKMTEGEKTITEVTELKPVE